MARKVSSAQCRLFRSGDKSIPDHSIGPHGKRNVLEILLAQIGELDLDLAANLIVGGRRDADAAGFADALEPRCDVDAVTEDIMRFDDDVADVDAHTKNEALSSASSIVSSRTWFWKMDGSSNRLDRARKLRQEPVAGVLDNAAAVFRNGWLDNVRQEGSQTRMRSLFVRVHEPRIAGHVGGHYRRQPASDPH